MIEQIIQILDWGKKNVFNCLLTTLTEVKCFLVSGLIMIRCHLSVDST